jgi:competence protein ComEC
MDYYGIKRLAFNNQKVRVILAIFIALNILVYYLLFSNDCFGLLNTNITSNLIIDFVNVGQGDCCVIKTPKGRTFVVDGGTKADSDIVKNNNRELIENYLKRYNVKELDGIVVTHWHADDFSGLVPVLKTYKVNCVYETPIFNKNEQYDKFDKICSEKKIKRVTVRSGNILEWGDDIFVQVLNPESNYGLDYDFGVNNGAIVLLIRYGKVQILLCSDIQEEAEREVIKYNEGIKSQIIKIPDHGSDKSAYKPFFKMVGAKDGIISVGKNNAFGYPSDKALDIFDELGIKIYRTDYNGNIHLKVGGKNEKDYTISVDRNI